MPAPPEEAIPVEHDTSPTDGTLPERCLLRLTDEDLSDLHGNGKFSFFASCRSSLEQLVASGEMPLKKAREQMAKILSELNPAADPITPLEALAELEEQEAEREAAELAAFDAAEAKAESQPGANRSWSELDTWEDMAFRRKLDFLDRVSIITNTFVKPAETSDGETVWKEANVPGRIERKLNRFLESLLDAGTSVAQAIGKEIGKAGGDDA